MIGGIVGGISGLLIIVIGALVLWYRRRRSRRKPRVLPRDVLQAEFAPDNDAVDSSTRLTPFLDSTITRYQAAPPPKVHPSPVSPSVRYDSGVRDGPRAYPSSSSYPSGSEPSSVSRFVVSNGDSSESGSRPLPDAAEEKRRLAVTMRERENRMEGRQR